MDTNIDEKSNFSEKGWNARNNLFYYRKRGSRHLKRYRTSKHFLSKSDVGERHAKSPKCIRNGNPNPSKIRLKSVPSRFFWLVCFDYVSGHVFKTNFDSKVMSRNLKIQWNSNGSFEKSLKKLKSVLNRFLVVQIQ